MVTERDIAILQTVCRYYVLSRQQIQRLCFPNDQTNRITRRRLQLLVDGHFINRHVFSVYSLAAGTPGAVYFPAPKACEFLAEHFDDERYLATPTRTPFAHHLFHWLAVSETHITIDAAIARQEAVKLDGWLSEWDVCNPQESAPEKRYRLYTLIRESPRLAAVPDAAFLLSTQGHSKIFYLEQDRNTSGVRQIAASKTPGYAAVADLKMHRRHFPATTLDSFAVLMVAPDNRRRDALRNAIAGKPGANLWRFVSATDLKPETFLHGEIFFSYNEGPFSLVKSPSSGVGECPQS
jgi:hypothetical protein